MIKCVEQNADDKNLISNVFVKCGPDGGGWKNADDKMGLTNIRSFVQEFNIKEITSLILFCPKLNFVHRPPVKCVLICQCFFLK